MFQEQKKVWVPTQEPNTPHFCEETLQVSAVPPRGSTPRPNVLLRDLLEGRDNHG